MDVKILVATTKEYRFPEDAMYVPIEGGRVLRGDKKIDGIIGDDTGDNISEKNSTYCELTCLYWAWRNLECDYIGLCHYRRLFASPRRKSYDKWEVILNKSELQELLKETPVILTKKRRYYIETLYSHYGHTHNAVDLKITRQVLNEKYPDYLKAYDVMENNKSAHMFNMFIMRKDKANEYCEWLFDILREIEKRLDISGYSDRDKRVFGRISELLLDVWLIRNNIRYKEVPLLFMENPHWPQKISGFIRAKYMSGKEL